MSHGLGAYTIWCVELQEQVVAVAIGNGIRIHAVIAEPGPQRREANVG